MQALCAKHQFFTFKLHCESATVQKGRAYHAIMLIISLDILHTNPGI